MEAGGSAHPGAEAQSSRIRDALRKHDTSQRGLLDRAHLEALLRDAVSTRLVEAELLKLKWLLDRFTDPHTGLVDYEWFVDWLYTPGTMMPTFPNAKHPTHARAEDTTPTFAGSGAAACRRLGPSTQQQATTTVRSARARDALRKHDASNRGVLGRAHLEALLRLAAGPRLARGDVRKLFWLLDRFTDPDNGQVNYEWFVDWLYKPGTALPTPTQSMTKVGGKIKKFKSKEKHVEAFMRCIIEEGTKMNVGSEALDRANEMLKDLSAQISKKEQDHITNCTGESLLDGSVKMDHMKTAPDVRTNPVEPTSEPEILQCIWESALESSMKEDKSLGEPFNVSPIAIAEKAILVDIVADAKTKTEQDGLTSEAHRQAEERGYRRKLSAAENVSRKALEAVAQLDEPRLSTNAVENVSKAKLRSVTRPGEKRVIELPSRDSRYARSDGNTSSTLRRDATDRFDRGTEEAYSRQDERATDISVTRAMPDSERLAEVPYAFAEADRFLSERISPLELVQLPEERVEQCETDKAEERELPTNPEEVKMAPNELRRVLLEAEADGSLETTLTKVTSALSKHVTDTHPLFNTSDVANILSQAAEDGSLEAILQDVRSVRGVAVADPCIIEEDERLKAENASKKPEIEEVQAQEKKQTEVEAAIAKAKDEAQKAEAAAKRNVGEDAWQQQLLEELAQKKRAEEKEEKEDEEEAARSKAAEEAKQKEAEEESKRRAKEAKEQDEAAKLNAKEQANKKAAEDEANTKQAEDAAAQKRKTEEDDEVARLRDVEIIKKNAEEDTRQRAMEAEAAQKEKAKANQKAKQDAWQKHIAQAYAEELARKTKAQEQAETAKLKAREEAIQKAVEEEAKRKKAEDVAAQKKRREEEGMRRRQERAEEAAREEAEVAKMKAAALKTTVLAAVAIGMRTNTQNNLEDAEAAQKAETPPPMSRGGEKEDSANDEIQGKASAPSALGDARMKVDECAKKQAEEESARLKVESKRKVNQDAWQNHIAQAYAEELARKKKAQEQEEAAKLKAREEAIKKAVEEEAKRNKVEHAAAQKKRREEEGMRRRQERAEEAAREKAEVAKINAAALKTTALAVVATGMRNNIQNNIEDADAAEKSEAEARRKVEESYPPRMSRGGEKEDTANDEIQVKVSALAEEDRNLPQVEQKDCLQEEEPCAQVLDVQSRALLCLSHAAGNGSLGEALAQNDGRQASIAKEEEQSHDTLQTQTRGCLLHAFEDGTLQQAVSEIIGSQACTTQDLALAAELLSPVSEMRVSDQLAPEPVEPEESNSPILGDEVQALAGVGHVVGGGGKEFYRDGDRGAVSKGCYVNSKGIARFEVTWYRTGLTCSVRRDKWLSTVCVIRKGQEPSVGDEMQALPGVEWVANGIEYYKEGDRGVVTKDVCVNEEDGTERYELQWYRTGLRSTIEKDLWLRSFRIVKRSKAILAAMSQGTEDLALAPPKSLLKQSEVQVLEQRSSQPVEPEESGNPSFGDEVQALAGVGHVVGGGGKEFYRDGDRGAVSKGCYVNSKGIARFEVTWYRTGLTCSVRSDKWSSTVCVIRKGQEPSVGDEMQALPGVEWVSNGIEYYKEGDRGVVTKDVCVDEEDGTERYELQWYRTGLRSAVVKSVWLESFRLIKKGKAMSRALKVRDFSPESPRPKDCTRGVGGNAHLAVKVDLSKGNPSQVHIDESLVDTPAQDEIAADCERVHSMHSMGKQDSPQKEQSHEMHQDERVFADSSTMIESDHLPEATREEVSTIHLDNSELEDGDLQEEALYRGLLNNLAEDSRNDTKASNPQDAGDMLEAAKDSGDEVTRLPEESPDQNAGVDNVVEENTFAVQREDLSVALRLAVQDGLVDTCKQLLARNADPAAQDTMGDCLPVVAARASNWPMVQTLVQCGFESMAPAKRIMQLNRTDDAEGKTLLHHVCLAGQAELATILLNLKADPMTRSRDGLLPVELAAYACHAATAVALQRTTLLESCNPLVQVILPLLTRTGPRPGVSAMNACLRAAASCDLCEVGHLLITSSAEINASHTDGSTALHVVSRHGHINFSKLLLEHGASTAAITPSGRTPLLIACQFGHEALVELLLDRTMDNDKNPAVMASKSGHERIVRFILKQRPLLASQLQDGWGAIHMATDAGHYSVLLALLENKAPIDMPTDCGCTAVHLASQKNETSMLRLLVDHKAAIDKLHTTGASALHLAAQNNCESVASLLLESRADTAITLSGATPLHSACQNGYVGIVELLLQSKASVDTEMQDGATALHLVCQNGGVQVVELLLRCAADVNAKSKDLWTPLLLASKRGWDEIVSMLLRSNADAEVAASKGWRPLMYASYLGHGEVVRELAAHSAVLDAPAQDMRTALIMATQKGHELVLRYLVEAGAKLDRAGQNGWRALHFACQKGRISIARTLLELRAGVDATTENGWVALHLASQNGDASSARLLLEYRARIDAQNDDRATALHVACQSNYVDVVRLLLDYKAASDTLVDGSSSALHMATQNGNAAIAQLLLERNANVNAQADGGATALHLTGKFGYAALTSILLKHGAALDAQVHAGWSTLMLACRNGHVDTVRILLGSGANANLQMQSGQTALHFACQYGDEGIVRLLLDANALVSANANSTVSKMPSALRVAKRYGQDTIVRLLTQYESTSETQGMCASGLILPLPGVSFDSANRSFYFGRAVYADFDSSYFPWGCGDFTFTVTVTPRLNGKVAASGDYAVLFTKCSDTDHPFTGPTCLVYNSGAVQFRLARTIELGRETKGVVHGGWQCGVPVKLTFLRSVDKLYIFQGAELMALQSVTASFDVSNDAPLRIGANHLNPQFHNLDAYLSGMMSRCTAIFPVRELASEQSK